MSRSRGAAVRLCQQRRCRWICRRMNGMAALRIAARIPPTLIHHLRRVRTSARRDCVRRAHVDLREPRTRIFDASERKWIHARAGDVSAELRLFLRR
eukprot:CAMPEP_0206130538 /NCGR_PEP_ID=MMETSP1472-20131121/41494_1 /ASSEMBLY_ACC=CAM_ASM_001108 /TAXON_ID=41880 /ORGANISM="Pycnococcus provasolii, Strain RCC251" /LENGTH=96 /DNA_ID=CAMNT_0053521895 /DNA_START=159 /DNA_END=446 /DNA_ORIENTATION=+